MKKIYYFLLLVLLFLLQATVFDSVRVFGVKPDLLLLAALVSGLLFDLKWALFFGISAGFLKDILGVQAAAFNILFFSCWSALSVFISRKVHLDSEVYISVFVFIMVASHIVVSRIVFAFLGIQTGSTGIFARTLLLEPVYTALILLPAYRIFARLA